MGHINSPKRDGPHREIFFISNTFLNYFPKLTLFLFFSKLTLLVAPIAMARRGGAAEGVTWHRPGP